MRFEIESLKMKNFKGLREQDVYFTNNTMISGPNASGKTTVVDAFSWLLFDKDSKGRANFEIKTLEDGEPIHGLDHLVEGTFAVDGVKMNLRKIYKEVWTKRRGESQETFTGHTTERFINDVPVKESEFKAKVGELIDEKEFKMLTDPLYFSQQLNWKDRRKALFGMAGGIAKEEVIEANPELKALEADLEEKDTDQLKAALAYQRKELNKKRENIPVKIETLNSTIKEVDPEAVEFNIRGLKSSIAKLEEQMMDASKASEEKLEKQDKLYELKSRLKEIEHEVKSEIRDPDEDLKAEISELKSKLREIESEASAKKRDVESLKKVVELEESQVEKLRADYKAEVGREVDLDSIKTECPTCNRPFEEGDIESEKEKMLENFHASQVERLESINEEGKAIKVELDRHKEELKEAEGELFGIVIEQSDLKTDMEFLEAKLGKTKAPSLESLLADHEEYQAKKAEIERLQEEISDSSSNSQIDELKKKKTEKEEELKMAEKELHQDEINKDTKAKIEELMDEEKELSQSISVVEQKQYLLDQFISTKAKLIEANVNDKFDYVSFRLFKPQVNGALDETCDVLVDGVPFESANTAGQVNAGLDIINALCEHHDVYAPIFIDNRESVTDIIGVNSQVVNLVVSNDKELTVKGEN